MHVSFSTAALSITAACCAGEGPGILLQPQTAALCSGAPATLTVRAQQGSSPLGYRWQWEVAPGQWADVPLREPAPGVWSRVSVLLEEPAGTCSLYFGWIGTQDTRAYRCIVSDDTGSTASQPMRLTALTADFGATGGVPGPDYVTDNNDFVVYMDAFFSGAQSADLGSAGGVRGGDGLLDNNDLVTFIDLFFNGCTELP